VTNSRWPPAAGECAAQSRYALIASTFEGQFPSLLGGEHLLGEAGVCAPHFWRMGQLHGLAGHLSYLTVATLRHIQVRHWLASYQKSPSRWIWSGRKWMSTAPGVSGEFKKTKLNILIIVKLHDVSSLSLHQCHREELHSS
jgi:hypothetical protein